MKTRFGLVVGIAVTLFGALPIVHAGNSEPPILVDVTKNAGIHFVHSIGDHDMSNIVESTGSGCAFFDYNGDGYLDIFLVCGAYVKSVSHVRGRTNQGKLFNALYCNNKNGTFSDVTASAGVKHAGMGMACLAADTDNDGDADLVVTNYGSLVFYRNNGDGTFIDVTKEAGLLDDLFAIGCTFLDYNNDGLLDLYVGHYLTYDPDYRYYYAPTKFPGPLAYEGQADRLFRNKGDGTFEDVSGAAGIGNPNGRAMGVGSCDVDADGDMDIFVANDGMENYLYRNNGDGSFTDIALETATGFGQNGEATSAMGPGFGDFNMDGLVDIMVPDMSYSTLYQNTGKGYFEEKSALLGLAVACGQYTSWSGNFVDIDNDTDVDIFISNGDSHELDPEEDLLLLNEGGKRFVDVSARCGPDFQAKFVSRGSATGDYDNDGDQDILVLNINERARLLRNDLDTGNHWLIIRTVGTRSNRDGIGARIFVTSGGQVQMRDVLSSSGYLSQSDPRPHFGLGSNARITKIEVRWPSGIVQILNDVKADQILEIIEPRS